MKKFYYGTYEIWFILLPDINAYVIPIRPETLVRLSR